MNTDTFIAQQRDMSESFVTRVSKQLQEFEGPDIEALVIGIDIKQAEIWSVDYKGTIRCYDDVGFHAIGIGAGHASLSLMQVGYTNNWRFAEALAATYNAKKVAETAPGVGTNTDIHLVGRHGWAALWADAFTAVERVYKDYCDKQAQLRIDCIKELSGFLFPKKSEATVSEAGQQSIGQDAQANERIGEDAPEASRGHEDREESETEKGSKAKPAKTST